MKVFKILAVFMIVSVFLIGATACGPDNNNGGTTTQETVDTLTTEEESAIQNETDNVVTAGEKTPVPDEKASVDDLMGTWKEINGAASNMTISKKGSGYQIKDSDGAYAATFKDGTLSAESGGITLEVYFDKTTKHIFATISNDPKNVMEYKKVG